MISIWKKRSPAVHCRGRWRGTMRYCTVFAGVSP